MRYVPNRDWQAYAMVVRIARLGHTMIGTDNWRHFDLLMGKSWGTIAPEQRWQMRLWAARGPDQARSFQRFTER